MINNFEIVRAEPDHESDYVTFDLKGSNKTFLEWIDKDGELEFQESHLYLYQAEDIEDAGYTVEEFYNNLKEI